MPIDSRSNTPFCPLAMDPNAPSVRLAGALSLLLLLALGQSHEPASRR